MTESSPWHLFEVFGVELEYMIVREDNLSVLPVTDQVLRSVAGEWVGDVEDGELCWSNELVLHVIEMKTNDPVPSLRPLVGHFNNGAARINELLKPLGGRLMPGAMHPWMNPFEEARLWPHEYNVVYETFNRIFDCRGHGWSNLQSVHINLPFCGDEEFGKLHAAIRLLLPIMPALAASSPILEGRATGLLDNRLNVYRKNAAKVPSVSGSVIPEPVFTREDYEKQILEKIYRDIAPYDAEGVLQHEWLNARGAIARFDRNSIEIRVLDIQECPHADLAIYAAIVASIKALVSERWAPLAVQQSWEVEPLQTILLETIDRGDQAIIKNRRYLELFGYDSAPRCTAGELWRHLIETLMPRGSEEREAWMGPLEVILDQGPLSRRILRALGPDFSQDRLSGVYRKLSDCLAQGKMFLENA